MQVNKDYIIFKDSELFFLKPAFRHCFLIRGLTIHETVWFRKRTIKISPKTKQDILDRYVRVEVLALGKFKGMTCVSCVKRAIGIYGWRIITPYQLFKKIK